MDVFFKPWSGSPFCIEVGYWDTVLEIKKKIEKYQGIPVSKQTLFLEGNVLQDHLNVEQSQILHNSRVFVFVSPYPYDNNDQVLQTEQSPIPSDVVKQIVVTLVLPNSGESKAVKYIYTFPSPTDQVKVLRNELVQIRIRRLLNLPQVDDNHFFVHKGRILNEDKSFEWNGVAHTDNVEIVLDPWLY